MPKSSKAKTLPCGRVREVHSHAQPRGEGWREALQEYLAKAGLKQSEPRMHVAEVALKQESHFNIQDLANQIKRSHPSLGAATVYRSIKTLCDAGILRETLVGDSGETVYEIAPTDHHDHIVCLDCQEIFEFHEASIERMQEKVCKDLGFSEARHSHVIYARCEILARKQK